MKNFLTKISLLFLSAVIFFLPATNASENQTIHLNNGFLRFGESGVSSITSTGNLAAPFVFNTGSEDGEELTYRKIPLNFAIDIGTSTDDPGTMFNSITGRVDPTLLDKEIDDTNFANGSGIIIVSGTYNIREVMIFVRHTYTLLPDTSYIKVTTEFKNPNLYRLENFRYWVGTEDDFIGTSDGTGKERGIIDTSSFQPTTDITEPSTALKIVEPEARLRDRVGILFYTDLTLGVGVNHTNMIIQHYAPFAGIIEANPAEIYSGLGKGSYLSTSTTENPQRDGGHDGSYALYFKFKDLEPEDSVSVTWFYASGPVENLNQITEEIGVAAQEVQKEISISQNPEIKPEPQPVVPEPQPEPVRPYNPPRLLIDIPGLEPNQETVIIDVFSDFTIPSGVVVYESTGRPFILQNIEMFGEVDTSTIGTYRVTYLYRHHDRGVIRRINFKVTDRVKPEATYEIESIYLGEEGIDDIVITDNYGTEFRVRVEGKIRTNQLGSYLLRYFISDLSGNSISFGRRVNVIAPPSEPEEIDIQSRIFYIGANRHNQYIISLSPQEYNTSGVQFFYQQATVKPEFDDTNGIQYEGHISTDGYEPILYLMAIDEDNNYFIREATIKLNEILDFEGGTRIINRTSGILPLNLLGLLLVFPAKYLYDKNKSNKKP